MTPMLDGVLVAVRARPGRRVYEIADEMQIGVPTAEAALRTLEACGFARRRVDGDHVVVWDAVGIAEGG